jgi:DNA-binding NarL/FixJ family response regulator
VIGDKIRVLLSSRPKLLSDVIRKRVELQADMEFAGEVPNPMELLRTPKVSRVDVVIVTPLETNGHSNICSVLLASYPTLKVVTLSENGKLAYLHRAGTPKSIIDSCGDQSILDAIIETIRLNGRG